MHQCGDGVDCASSCDVSVLYMSDNYVVVDKGHDLLLNCNDPNSSMTLQKQLCVHLPHLADSTLTHQFRFPHRLDFATSGALCVALNKRAAQMAVESFTSRSTDKYYLALLRGHVDKNLTIDLPVGKDGRPQHSHRMCSACRSHCVAPRTAKTQLLVLQQGRYDGEAATKVLLKPSTGRRHQLRVHCMEVGHLIVGDYTYSDRKDSLPFRMFLHAFRLVIPTTDELVDVTTCDPFVEDEPRNLWKPEVTLCELDGQTFSQFNRKDLFAAWDQESHG